MGDSNPIAALAQKAMQCSSKSSAACTGDCEWKQDENKCDLNGIVAMQAMMGAQGGANNPMAALAQKAMECSSKSSGACSGDCEWKQDENKCDLSGAVAMQAMMGAAGGADNPMGALMQKAMVCSSKSTDTCSGECEWKQAENKCDLSGVVAMQAMMG